MARKRKSHLRVLSTPSTDPDTADMPPDVGALHTAVEDLGVAKGMVGEARAAVNEDVSDAAELKRALRQAVESVTRAEWLATVELVARDTKEDT